MGAINTINSVITVITDIRFVGDIAIDVVLVTNGITIINIINLTGISTPSNQTLTAWMKSVT
jgi:hypothetical protein